MIFCTTICDATLSSTHLFAKVLSSAGAWKISPVTGSLYLGLTVSSTRNEAGMYIRRWLTVSPMRFIADGSTPSGSVVGNVEPVGQVLRRRGFPALVGDLFGGGGFLIDRGLGWEEAWKGGVGRAAAVPLA